MGDVAKSAGLSRRELQAAERGAKRLSADELHALAGALGVDPDVLVGVGFEGELVRAGTVDDRIGQVIGHDPARWDDLPNPVDDLPQPLPVNLLEPGPAVRTMRPGTGSSSRGATCATGCTRRSRPAPGWSRRRRR